MPRTTLDIDAPILEEIRRLQRREGLSMGTIVSRLLARALEGPPAEAASPHELQWTSRRMRPLVDISDKDALYAVLDRDRR